MTEAESIAASVVPQARLHECTPSGTERILVDYESRFYASAMTLTLTGNGRAPFLSSSQADWSTAAA